MKDRDSWKDWGRLGLLIGLLIGLMGGSGCGPSDEINRSDLAVADSNPIPRVCVVNYPLYFFVERIAGDRVEVLLPKSSGIDPAFWRPSDEEIQMFQRADLILMWGAGYAKWLTEVSLPQGKLVDTGKAIQAQWIYDEDAVTHSHGDEGEHSHGKVAFTTWLDFTLALRQGEEVKKALAALLPDQAASFEGTFRRLQADLTDLDRQMRAAVAKNGEQALFASHPVYQYLERRYGLTLKSFHWEPGETPGEEAWEAFESSRSELKVKWMLWEGQPSEEPMVRMRAFGVEPLVFPTGGGIPEEGDFLALMRGNIHRLSEALNP